MKPLPIEQNYWPSRWLITDEWDALHRVAEITWGYFAKDGSLGPAEPDDMIEGLGKTCCGLEGKLRMPGFLSRLDLPRCPKCCEIMGIPVGKGNPYNEKIYEVGDVPLGEKNPAGNFPAGS